MQLLLVLLLAVVASAAPQFRQLQILNSDHQQDPAGSYRSSYRTENGISVDETGYLSRTNDGLDNVVEKQGTVSYTSPEGIPIQFTYIATKYGVKVIGNHLPQNVQAAPPTF